jgi:hypothetical protein
MSNRALAFYVPLTSKYLDMVFLFWVYYIVKKQNRNNEALIAGSYVVGVSFENDRCNPL